MHLRNLPELLVCIAERDDTKAFKEVFEHFFPGLLSFSYSVLQNRMLAEEVVEDVFIKLWENRQMLPTIKSLPYYLYVATKHASLNYLHQQRRTETAFLEEMSEGLSFSFSSPEYNFISTENLHKIAEAINTLPPRCRLIFRLIKEEGLKHKEVAQLLGVSLKTVEAQMTTSLRKIVDILQITLPEYMIYYDKRMRGNL